MVEGANFRDIHQHLIDACKEQDSNSQLRIYKIYYKSMFNTAIRILHHTAEAEDCMQEAFLKAFSKIDTYHNEVTFGSWLKRIVVNTCLDALRKRKMDIIEAEQLPETPDESSIFSDYDENYTVQCIKECISKLPQSYRIITSLYLLEGYDHEEIADILKISNATSRTQLHRAKQKLVMLIKEKQKITL